MSIIQLYKYDFEQTVVINNNNFGTNNMPINNQDIITYKGATKRVYFNLLDYDNRPVIMDVTSELRLLVHNPRNDSISIKKVLIKSTEVPAIPGTSRPSLRKQDPNIGKYYCDLNIGDIQKLDIGSYTWSVYQYNDDSGNVTTNYLSTDFNSKSTGTLIVKDDAVPTFIESDVVDLAHWAKHVEGIPQITTYQSPALRSASQKELLDGIHSTSITTEDYTGSIFVQGCMTDVASEFDQDWFNVVVGDTTDDIILDNATGTIMINFTIQCMWIRIVHQPSDSNIGELVKVLYRA